MWSLNPYVEKFNVENLNVVKFSKSGKLIIRANLTLQKWKINYKDINVVLIIEGGKF